MFPNEKFKLLNQKVPIQPQQQKDAIIVTTTTVIPFADLVSRATNEQLTKLLKVIYAEMAKRGVKE